MYNTILPVSWHTVGKTSWISLYSPKKCNVSVVDFKINKLQLNKTDIGIGGTTCSQERKININNNNNNSLGVWQQTSRKTIGRKQKMKK